MNNFIILMFCWETLGPSPDPNPIKHPWDVQEQVQSMEAPPNCGSDFALDTGPVRVSCCVWHQGVSGYVRQTWQK